MEKSSADQYLGVVRMGHRGQQPWSARSVCHHLTSSCKIRGNSIIALPTSKRISRGGAYDPGSSRSFYQHSVCNRNFNGAGLFEDYRATIQPESLSIHALALHRAIP